MKHNWKIVLFLTDEHLEGEEPLNEEAIRYSFEHKDLDAGTKVKVLSVQKLND